MRSYLSTVAALEKTDYFFQTLLPAMSVGLLTMALILAKTGRDALFFQGRGLFQLPMAYMGSGMASLPAAFLFVQAMKIWGIRPTRVGIIIFAAMALAAFVPFLKPDNYPVLVALFIFIPTIFGILFATIWLQVYELFENEPKMVAARSFSRIGASALAGGMVGGFLSKGFAPYLDPKWLVILGASVILVVVGVVIKTHQHFPLNIVEIRGQNKGEKLSFSRAFSKKYARTLLLISVLAALAGLFIDFQFYAAASGGGMGSKGNANFFANFYILLNLSSLILQLFAAPKIQEKVGLRGALVILPLGLLGGTTFVTAAATALSKSVLKVTEGGLKASIHRSIWEQAFIRVESEERPFVKMFVDGIGRHIAEAIGATLLFVWLRQADVTDPSSLNTGWIAWTILLTVAVWLLLTRNLSPEVDQLPPAIDPAVTSLRETEIECARFPDQCPFTTEWGKRLAGKATMYDTAAFRSRSARLRISIDQGHNESKIHPY